MGSARIIFTPAADNAAIFGAAQSMKRRGKRVVTTALEHPAVANCMKRLEEEGFDVVRLPCREGGHFPGEDLAAALTAALLALVTDTELRPAGVPVYSPGDAAGVARLLRNWLENAQESENIQEVQ